MTGPRERGRVFVLVVLDVIVESLSNSKTGAAGAPALILILILILATLPCGGLMEIQARRASEGSEPSLDCASGLY